MAQASTSTSKNEPSADPGGSDFSEFLARDTSKSSRVFRRFDNLALQNILRLGAELDKVAKGKEPEDVKAVKLNNALKAYYESLYLYSLILKLEAPTSRTVEALQNWLNKHQRSPQLQHYELLDRNNSNMAYTDLISLYTPVDNDLLTRCIHRSPLRTLFIDYKMSKPDEYYLLNERSVQKFVTFVGLGISVGFLVGAMWALWKEGDNLVAKLATVTGFVLGFACWVGFATPAGRKEVVSATAAYAAVLVVYVGSTELKN